MRLKCESVPRVISTHFIENRSKTCAFHRLLTPAYAIIATIPLASKIKIDEVDDRAEKFVQNYLDFLLSKSSAGSP